MVRGGVGFWCVTAVLAVRNVSSIRNFNGGQWPAHFRDRRECSRGRLIYKDISVMGGRSTACIKVGFFGAAC
jgi:hypothetical protein